MNFAIEACYTRLRNECIASSSRLKRSTRFLYLRTAGVVILFAFVLFLKDRSFVTLTGAVAVLFYIGYAHRWTNCTYRDFETRRRKGQLRPLDADERHVANMISSLTDQMDLNETIQTWVADDDLGLCPSIFESRRLTYLVIPIAFSLLVERHPLRARAMLAHELSHVMQGDAHLWPVCVGLELATRRIMHLFALLLGINACLAVVAQIIHEQMIARANEAIRFSLMITGHDAGPPVNADVGGYVWLVVRSTAYCMFLMWFAYRGLSKHKRKLAIARRFSETAADCGAIVHVAPQALIDALTQHVKDQAASWTHPAKSARVAQIKDWLHSWNDAPP